MKIQMLSAIIAFGLTGCGLSLKKVVKVESPKDQCKIQYHDVVTGKSGETEYLPRDIAVARIKAIKSLPGFPKLDTDQWLSCK